MQKILLVVWLAHAEVEGPRRHQFRSETLSGDPDLVLLTQ